MNCQEAKQISIFNWLKSAGFESTKIQNNSAWYISPVRNESTASFVVDLNKNTWRDFGSGKHGDIVDLVCLILNTTVLEALKILDRYQESKPVNFSFQKQNIPKTPGIKITKVGPIEHHVLIQYCEMRKIPIDLARIYLQEVHYLNGKNKYEFFALDFKNDKGGYALRSPYFKAASSPNYYTTIPGIDHTVLSIFEGFFDFLSSFVLYDSFEIPGNDCIILNSTSFVNDTLELLKDYEVIFPYLDNDPAGRQATDLYKTHHSSVNDQSYLYKTEKDFNELLMKKDLSFFDPRTKIIFNKN